MEKLLYGTCKHLNKPNVWLEMFNDGTAVLHFKGNLFGASFSNCTDDGLPDAWLTGNLQQRSRAAMLGLPVDFLKSAKWQM